MNQVKETGMTCTNPLRGKHILLVFCSLELGGAERQGLHLARYLKNLGCDVRVWGTLIGSGLVASQCEAAGIPWAVHRFLWPCRKSSLLRDGWRMLRDLWRERPDVILTYTTFPNVGCGLVWRWSPAKVCIWSQRDIHGLQGDAVERFAYRRVSAVICNASHEVDYLHRILGSTPASVSVVYNGTELAPCRKTRAEWRTDLGIADDAVVVTMVANFRQEKEHPVLLNAWRMVQAAVPKGQTPPRLLLAGAPQNSYESVYQLASDLSLLNTVSFPGQVKDISGLLAASDIGVLVSKYEGLSNVVIEYMASGLPVVATDLPGTREALGEELRQPFCSTGDFDDLAARLLTLIDNPALRKELGERNRHRAAENFSVEVMCQKTADVITGFLKK